MAPTPEFSEDLAAALHKGADNEKRGRLQRFFAKYGYAIATEVHLGGHLHTTKVTSSEAKVLAEITEVDTLFQELKAEEESQLRASFSAAFGEGSASYAAQSKNSAGSTQSSANLSVAAVGGNTLLSSNITLWPLSLMPYANWRATKISKIKLLIDIRTLFTKDQSDAIVKILNRSKVVI
ncbi:hypothetical protein FRC06_006306 [Ceratobasidium sp. 370]|nr:hypothetical protein FRC06_006306 [Ceratobasidium sp. 370]